MPNLTNLTCIFSHGKESGPNGLKLTELGRVASALGARTVNIDYRETMDPERRIDIFKREIPDCAQQLVLVGSSMGAYVSTVISNQRNVNGLFLLAPAWGLLGYRERHLLPKATAIHVVHGWQDEVIQPGVVIDGCMAIGASLTLVDDDHRLGNSIPTLKAIFKSYLEENFAGVS